MVRLVRVMAGSTVTIRNWLMDYRRNERILVALQAECFPRSFQLSADITAMGIVASIAAPLSHRFMDVTFYRFTFVTHLAELFILRLQLDSFFIFRVILSWQLAMTTETVTSCNRFVHGPTAHQGAMATGTVGPRKRSDPAHHQDNQTYCLQTADDPAPPQRPSAHGDL
jgi:hypothetical protein